MDLTIPPEAEKLQQEMRAFLRDELPPELAQATLYGRKLSKDDHQRWQRILEAKGWLTPSWPTEYGGTGWGPLERFLWDEESALAGAPRANIPSLDLLGPVIVEFGTEAQKAEFLPRILSGEDWWCQGFSEPQAGSDLAALQMRAVRDGDDYVVNGTKLWTSWAHMANKIFCLVRTSTDGPKQAGISFLLIDMEQPGIEVTPIYTLGGMLAVNQVRIEDVRVPVTNLLGNEGDAWNITKFLLGHERLVGAGIGPSLALARQLRAGLDREGADGQPIGNDPILSQRVAEVETDLMALRYTAYRVLADELSGKAPGAEVSVLKIRGGEIQQALTELLMEVGEIQSLAHPYTLPDGVLPFETANMSQQYFDRRKLTIYGGSSEIQRNIIARRLLNV
ncbi:MAG: pimeloyl-CoA dehydrogenase large subunit [Sphingomonadales bacterium]|nr:MAG: pimeloyl-CoA dehydrogenase large subunit [Sphingomonadales bacterium]